MAVSFSRVSCWLWGGAKDQEVPASGQNSATDMSLKFPMSNRTMRSSRRVKRKWQSREERRIDKEYDVVIVPSDGGFCLSGSDSDDSDWSIGWMERLGPEFEGEAEGSFAVLVPCYGRGRCEEWEVPKERVLGATESDFFGAVGFHDVFSSGELLNDSLHRLIDGAMLSQMNLSYHVHTVAKIPLGKLNSR